jgi:hypothetical protein
MIPSLREAWFLSGRDLEPSPGNYLSGLFCSKNIPVGIFLRFAFASPTFIVSSKSQWCKALGELRSVPHGTSNLSPEGKRLQGISI